MIGGGDWAIDRIVPDCIRAWSTGESVGVRNPQATRPWQHVLEPLSGYLWLGARLLAGQSGLNGEAFNFGPGAQVNEMTVQRNERDGRKSWRGARWRAEDSGAQSREATLLRLSCDKALFHLGWHTALAFRQTVEFTVAWYRCWHEGRVNMYDYSLAQIEAYCGIAQQCGIAWATR